MVLLVFGILYVLFLTLVGCSPAPQAQGQLPMPTPAEQRWTFIPMTSGPGIYTACVKGDRLYAMDSLSFRASEWTPMGAKTITVAAGACR